MYSIKSSVLLLFVICFNVNLLTSQEVDLVRGFAIAAPERANVDRFVEFIKEELGPRNINTLILRVDYNFQFQSHPELSDEEGLSREMVNQIVHACQESGISIIPQINLLGHQSWHSELENLLSVYPEFDETPEIELPDEYAWPNEDGLYCKSYCPLHPDLHKIVFALVDEIVEAFGATAFHAGMDEVFYIGEDTCPRCRGREKARLFADELTLIRDHLAKSDVKLWIWGDRLLDGRTSGLGMWEGSMNNTHQAIDMIPKDIVICDWHYEKAEPTPIYFAMKGFDVVACPWRKSEVALAQKSFLEMARMNANLEVKNRLRGMVHTSWSSASSFMDRFEMPLDSSKVDDAACFKVLFGN